MSLNHDYNNRKESNNIMLSSLTKTYETLARSSRWKKILLWDDYPDLKGLILKRRKMEEYKKNFFLN